MVEQFKLFLGSLGFLSIIPTGMSADLTGKTLAKSAAFFPAAGLVIGVIAMSLTIAFDAFLPGQVTNALLVLYLAVITGGLHLDALADTVDGFVGARTRSARLKIMRQGASGPLGVAAVTLALLLKYTFLNSLSGPPRLLALLAVPAIARWPMIWLAWRLPAVRRGGLGYIFAEQTGFSDVAVSGTMAAAICLYLASMLGWANLLIIPLVFFLAVAGVKINQALINGVTGDTLGAMVEISEVTLILTISIIAQYG